MPGGFSAGLFFIGQERGAPAVNDEGKGGRDDRPPGGEDEEGGFHFMPETILVVDDDPQISRLVSLNLTRAGYAVTTASDGEEALAKIAEARPDLVVLDVMMPRM